jgi:HEAT repeat protein
MRMHSPSNHSRAWRIMMCTICLMLCMGITSVHAQSNSSYGIRYTIDIWTGADQASIAVLMPRSARLSGKDPQAVLKGLFGQMKRGASAKYGATSIAFKDGSSKATPEVFIWLDESKSERHNEIIAEVVYTFSEQGINAVHFPKFKMQPVTRADISYAAFNLTLPIWQAIGLDSKHIWTQLPNGARISTYAFNQRLQKLDAEIIKAAWSQLKLSDEAAFKVLNIAVSSKFPNRMKPCTSAIESAEAKLRILGARCLANLDKRHAAAVASPLSDTLLEDPEDSVRDAVQNILRDSPHASLRQIALMRDLVSSKEQVVLKSISLVEKLKSKAVTKALQSLLSHKSPAIRKSTRTSLLKRKEATVLAQVVSDKEVSAALRQETALSMLGTGTVKVQAMSYLAGAGTAIQWAEVAKGLESTPVNTQISILTHALENKTQSVVLSGLDKFGALDGKAALDSLLEFKAPTPDIEARHLQAINSICSKLSNKALIATSNSKDLRLKKCAVKTLASKARSGNSGLKRKLLPILKKLARDKNTGLRALAIEGLGDLNEKSTHGLIIKAATDPNPDVVAAAAGALRHISTAEPILLKLSTHASPKVIAEVFRAMSVHGYAAAVPLILESASRPELSIRLAGTTALGRLSAQISNPKSAFNFYSVRLNDSDPKVRSMALIGLSKNKDPRRVQAMASLAQDGVVDVQVTAIKLLGESGDMQAVEGASSGLAHADVVVRSAAINALKKLGGSESSSILKRHKQQEKDPALLKLLK